MSLLWFAVGFATPLLLFGLMISHINWTENRHAKRRAKFNEDKRKVREVRSSMYKVDVHTDTTNYMHPHTFTFRVGTEVSDNLILGRPDGWYYTAEERATNFARDTIRDGFKTNENVYIPAHRVKSANVTKVF